MESTLQALGGILLRAVPTFLLVLLLHFYLKQVFFSPLEEVLQRRREATAGAREAAELALRQASLKVASYEASLGVARGDIYREQEEARKRWLADQSRLIEEARGRARETIVGAKAGIAAEVEQARGQLSSASNALASEIAQRLLDGRAS